jgi:hypothetical protein
MKIKVINLLYCPTRHDTWELFLYSRVTLLVILWLQAVHICVSTFLRNSQRVDHTWPVKIYRIPWFICLLRKAVIGSWFSDAFLTTLVIGLIMSYEMIVNEWILEETAKPKERSKNLSR